MIWDENFLRFLDMKDRLDKLVENLFDKKGDLGSRDDAAMDLEPPTHRGRCASATDRVKLLIDILYDNTAREDELDDAIMDLAEFHRDDRALQALVTMGSQPQDNAQIAESYGEAIAEILIAQDTCRRGLLENLDPLTRWYATDYIKSCKPEWIEAYSLEEFLK